MGEIRMNQDQTNPVESNFTSVKNEVTDLLGDESTKRLWSSILKWLEDNGEEGVRENLEAYAEELKTSALAKLSELETKIPIEE